MAAILIVDDDPVQRRLLDAALAKAGHETIAADSGEAALAALEGPRGGDVAAVVLDLMMPGMGGLGALEAMHARGISVPVIVQTAQGGIAAPSTSSSSRCRPTSCRAPWRTR